MKTYASKNEFKPNGASSKLTPRKAGAMLEVSEGYVTMSSEHTKHQIKGFIQSDKPGWLQINQLYFVGWNVRIDGEAIETQTLEEAVSSDGLIRVAFSPPLR